MCVFYEDQLVTTMQLATYQICQWSKKAKSWLYKWVTNSYFSYKFYFVITCLHRGHNYLIILILTSIFYMYIALLVKVANRFLKLGNPCNGICVSYEG